MKATLTLVTEDETGKVIEVSVTEEITEAEADEIREGVLGCFELEDE